MDVSGAVDTRLLPRHAAWCSATVYTRRRQDALPTCAARCTWRVHYTWSPSTYTSGLDRAIARDTSPATRFTRLANFLIYDAGTAAGSRVCGGLHSAARLNGWA